MTIGSGGTSLGNVGQFPSENNNSIARTLLGSSNYAESSIRCFLRSSGAAGSAWTPQGIFSRPPTWASDTAGFLYGIDSDFLAVVGDVKKRTADFSYSTDINIVESEEKFFLPGRAEAYADTAGMYGEGQSYPYFSKYSDFNAPSQYNDSNRIKNAGSSASTWWLRTASGVYSTHYISATGSRSSADTTASRGVVPVCCIV